MAVAANRRVPTHAGPIRVDALPAQIPAHAWQKHSAGAGAHGPRLYSWAWFGLLADRSLFPGGRPGCMHPSSIFQDHGFPISVPIWTIGMYSTVNMHHRYTQVRSYLGAAVTAIGLWGRLASVRRSTCRT